MPANQPVSPNAATVQGASPDGSVGYPVNVVPTPGAAAFDVNIVAGGGGAVTIADGADVAEGATTDAAVTGDNAGTISAKLRGLLKLLGSLFTHNGSSQANGFTSPILGSANYSFDPFTGDWPPFQSIPLNSLNNGPNNIAGVLVSAFPRAYDAWTGNYETLVQAQSAEAASQSRRVLAVCSMLSDGGTANNGLFEQTRRPTTFKTVQANANGNTVLWTPTAGTKFRLMRYMVMLTENATLGGAAVLTISLNDAGTAIGQAHDVYVPAAALATSGNLYVSPWIDLGNGILSAAINQVLNVNLSAALVTGNVRVIACGTEE